MTLWSRPRGAKAFSAVKSVATDSSGSWLLAVRPRIATSYRAVSRSATSPTLLVRVRPRVTLARVHGRLVVHVAPAAAFRGRTVTLQTRRNGRWASIARRPLARTGAAAFRSLPGTVRAAVATAPGYLAAASRALPSR